MNKTTRLGRIIPLLLLVIILATFVPFAGIACGSEGTTAAFTASPTSGVGPLEVQFTDQSTGEIITWEWDFNGDGTIDSVQQNPTYTYTTNAAYTVSLKVTSADGTDTVTKTDYINSSKQVYQKMTLKMNNPWSETDPNGLAAAKFKELVEKYTDGTVTVNLYNNATLYNFTEGFEALRSGAIDVAMIHPAFVRGINPNMDPLGALRGQVASWSHEQKVVADPAVQKFVVDTYGGYNVRFLGYIDAFIIGGLFSPSVNLKSYADINGVKYWSKTGGPVGANEMMWGANPVFVTQQDLPLAISQGRIEVVELPPDMAWFTGMYKMFKYALITTWAFQPSSIQMNMASWNKMEKPLQDLISTKVMPEVQANNKAKLIDIIKKSMLGLKLSLTEIHVVSEAKELEAYALVQNQADFKAVKAKMDPGIMALIDGLRPATPVMDPEIIDILNFAGIPIPQ